MKLGMNIDGVQKSNRSLILRLMLTNNAISRVELSKKTGLRKATITNIINEFFELGIIEECGQITGARGRKTDILSLKVNGARILSFRINRRFFEIGTFSIHGELVDVVRQSIDTNVSIDITYQSIKVCLSDIADKLGNQNILGMCIGVPGPFIQTDKCLTLVTGFEQLKNIDLQEKLSKDFNFPIFIQHDAKLSALAEWKSWCQRTTRTEGILVDIISVGQGVGAGIIINDKIIKGSIGIAGEIGYMGINFNGPAAECGNRGILENYSSAESIRRYVLDRLTEFQPNSLNEESQLEEIYLEYDKGNPLAVWAIEKTAWHLGYGIASIIAVLNPDIIIIGAEYPRNEKFIDVVRSTVKQLVYTELYDYLQIDFSQVEENAILTGGYNYVIDKLINSQQILDKIKNVVNSL